MKRFLRTMGALALCMGLLLPGARAEGALALQLADEVQEEGDYDELTATLLSNFL